MATASFLSAIQKRWFLVALLVIIPGGMLLGASLSNEALASLVGNIPTKGVTAAVLFLMAVSLDSRLLGASLRSPGPVVLASLVNLGLVPLLAWGIMDRQMLPDFRYGLLIAGSVPCTLAAASVWTRKAHGNDAVSLLVTLVTNGLCFLITPFWLNLATAGRSVQLDARSMIADLAVVVLLPTLAGQLLRQVPIIGAFATRHKIAIGVVAQLLILSVVFRGTCEAGRRMESFGPGLNLTAVIFVWGTCIILHLIGMAAGIGVARLCGFQQRDQSAVAFAASQKTLPIGIFLATDPTMFGNPHFLEAGIGIPFAVFPIMMYHVSQLFIDTVVADILAARSERIAETAAAKAPDAA